MGSLNNIKVENFARVSPISERIYVTLKDAILSGSLPPGEVITEIGLSSLFTVSRTPAREAIRRLENEGILENVPRQGVIVQNIRISDIMAIYDTAIALEPKAASLAAENKNTLQIEVMESLLELNNNSSNLSSTERNHRLHLAISEASGNKYIINFITQIRERLLQLSTYENIQSSLNMNLEDFYTTHIAIFEAIRDGNKKDAFILMEEHLIDSKMIFKKSLLQNRYYFNRFRKYF